MPQTTNQAATGHNRTETPTEQHWHDCAVHWRAIAEKTIRELTAVQADFATTRAQLEDLDNAADERDELRRTLNHAQDLLLERTEAHYRTLQERDALREQVAHLDRLLNPKPERLIP